MSEGINIQTSFHDEDLVKTTGQIYNKQYNRKVDKSKIPVCNILGVNIAAIDMEWTLDYFTKYTKDLSGDYVCVSNVHTTVTSYEDPEYCDIQNGGIMALPDGGPLSSVGRKRGHNKMARVTGPSLMGEIFNISAEKRLSTLFLWIYRRNLREII